MTTIYALHGFLGSPSDWNFLNGQDFGLYQIVPIDLFSICLNSSLSSWAKNFTANLKKSSILLGYSLGGRLALHALFEKPTLWKAAIFLSTHPGLISEEEKKKRLKQDELWAEKFLKNPWDLVLKEWNEQKVFSKSAPIQRNEKDYNKETLAHALQAWSLGKQENFREKIAGLFLPILWMYGECDEAYQSLANSLHFALPLSSRQAIASSGHRAAWDQPDRFRNQIFKWLREIDLL